MYILAPIERYSSGFRRPSGYLSSVLCFRGWGCLVKIRAQTINIWHKGRPPRAQKMESQVFSFYIRQNLRSASHLASFTSRIYGPQLFQPPPRIALIFDSVDLFGLILKTSIANQPDNTNPKHFELLITKNETMADGGKPGRPESPLPYEYWRSCLPKDWREEKNANFIIHFSSKASRAGPDEKNLMLLRENLWEWEAVMRISSRHIPRLLKRGVHWSLENMQRKRGHICINSQDIPPIKAREGWKHERNWILRDRSGDPDWHGTLKVFTKNKTLTFTFELEWLRQANIQRYYAFNWHNEMIYRFDRDPNEPIFSMVHGCHPQVNGTKLFLKDRFGGKLTREEAEAPYAQGPSTSDDNPRPTKRLRYEQ